MISRRSFLKGGADGGHRGGRGDVPWRLLAESGGGRPFCSGRIRRRHERRSMEREMVV